MKITIKCGFNKECSDCKYLYLCKTGCPYVKNTYKTNKSYTCKLQQEIYKNNFELYPKDENNEETTYMYLNKMHPNISHIYYPKEKKIIFNDMPSLTQIIEKDERLKNIYSSDVFILKVDDTEYKLESQIIRNSREIIYLAQRSNIKLYIKHGVLEDCDYPASNSLYMMLLTGDMLQYGDEQRIKQEHIMTHQVFTNTIKKGKSDKEGYYCIDITKILCIYYDNLSKERPNNLFFTTTELRDYHYTKHKNNAYYHIQAINLPFQNIEFFYIDDE